MAAWRKLLLGALCGALCQSPGTPHSVIHGVTKTYLFLSGTVLNSREVTLPSLKLHKERRPFRMLTSFCAASTGQTLSLDTHWHKALLTHNWKNLRDHFS